MAFFLKFAEVSVLIPESCPGFQVCLRCKNAPTRAVPVQGGSEEEGQGAEPRHTRTPSGWAGDGGHCQVLRALVSQSGSSWASGQVENLHHGMHKCYVSGLFSSQKIRLRKYL